ncbi:MAG: hypothetical protein WA941_19330 [Nitrososphaeraceae archaeon]
MSLRPGVSGDSSELEKMHELIGNVILKVSPKSFWTNNELDEEELNELARETAKNDLVE